MHTQHFPKTVLFTSQGGQRDRGHCQSPVTGAAKTTRAHISSTATGRNKPRLYQRAEAKRLRFTQISLWIQKGADPGMGLHGGLAYPTCLQLTHSQHHQTRRHFHSDGTCMKSSNVVLQDRPLLEFIFQHQCRKLE